MPHAYRASGLFHLAGSWRIACAMRRRRGSVPWRSSQSAIATAPCDAESSTRQTDCQTTRTLLTAVSPRPPYRVARAWPIFPLPSRAAKMGIACPFCGYRSQQDALLMMGGHMPHESLVDRRFASRPWEFADVSRKQCGGAEPQQATNRAKAADSQKCPALKHLLFRRRATKPSEQRIHGCRGKVNEEADPVRLLQCEDRLPERKQRDQNEPFEGGGQDCPRHGRGRKPSRMQVGGPFSKTAEEHERLREVRPLVKGDADRHDANRRLRGQGPVKRGYGGYGHPVHGSR
jgi:hypothetical protein